MRLRFLMTGAAAMAMALGVAVFANAGEGATKADVFLFEDLDGAPVGDAKLTRNRDGIGFDVHTTELEPEYPYTIWWIIYNNPDACDRDCDFDDLGVSGVEGSVLYATGRVADEVGNGWFTAFLPKGLIRLNRAFDPVSGDGGRERHRIGPGLQNVKGSVIELVIRSHGAALSGAALVEQLATFNGGCDNPPNGGDIPDDECEDVQFVEFPLPDDDDEDDEDDG